MFNNPLPSTSPMSPELQTEKFPADWEGSRAGKRGWFCSHFGLLHTSPFCQKECRSPCCRTPQQVPQPSLAPSLCNRLKSFGLTGAKKNMLAFAPCLTCFGAILLGKQTNKYIKNITWTGTWRKPGESSGLCSSRAW